jgi:hypothetical protein
MTSQIPTQVATKLPVSQIPCISYHGMSRSAKIMRRMTTHYFPMYGLSAHDFFDYYPLLGFVEALVYQIDEETEALQQNSLLSKNLSVIQAPPWHSKLQSILSLLEELNITHIAIQKYVDELREYWDLETKLMIADIVTHTDVIWAVELRHSDIRVLHTILVLMLGKPYRREVFDLLWPLEAWVNLNADVKQYEKDQAAGHYNTYRIFVKLYGKEAPDYMRAEIERYDNLFQERLKQFPADEQEIYSQFRFRYRQTHFNSTIPEPILED